MLRVQGECEYALRMCKELMITVDHYANGARCGKESAFSGFRNPKGLQYFTVQTYGLPIQVNQMMVQYIKKA